MNFAPESAGNAEGREDLLAHNRLGHESEAHLLQLGGRRLDLLLDLAKAEGEGSALVPVGRAFRRVEGEAHAVRAFAPIRPFRKREAAHQVEDEDEVERAVEPNPPRETVLLWLLVEVVVALGAVPRPVVTVRGTVIGPEREASRLMVEPPAVE